MRSFAKNIIIATIALSLLSGCGIRGTLDLQESLDEQVDATQ